MAQIRLQPPVPFNFKQPDDWSRWKCRFEQFRLASGLDTDPAVKQVSTLLYCMGEEADVVLASTNITEEAKKVYETVCGKFDDFFKVLRNVIFERARFNRRNSWRENLLRSILWSCINLLKSVSMGYYLM